MYNYLPAAQNGNANIFLENMTQRSHYFVQGNAIVISFNSTNSELQESAVLRNHYNNKYMSFSFVPAKRNYLNF